MKTLHLKPGETVSPGRFDTIIVHCDAGDDLATAWLQNSVVPMLKKGGHLHIAYLEPGRGVELMIEPTDDNPTSLAFNWDTHSPGRATLPATTFIMGTMRDGGDAILSVEGHHLIAFVYTDGASWFASRLCDSEPHETWEAAAVEAESSKLAEMETLLRAAREFVAALVSAGVR